MDELGPQFVTFERSTPLSNKRPIIRIFHDESTFFSNADQSFHWADERVQVLKQESLALMSLMDIYDGEEAREFLEHQSQGFWNSEHMVKQVNKCITIFENKYANTTVTALFIFDNAPSHMKKANDALNADAMNVNPGGKQPAMRQTVYNGNIQEMTLPNGTAKGMKMVLEERGVCTKGMVAKDMTARLKTYEDLKNSKTILCELIESKGHMCVYLPKFHCELNPIERCWCQAKKYTRAYSNGSIVRLRKIVPEGMETATKDMIKKFFQKSKDYKTAYREGYTTENVDSIVKLYKSHRRVGNQE